MEGFNVAGTATTGSGALAFLENHLVDCILLDIFMPDFDGLDLLKKIRGSGADTDAIIISAANEGDKIQEALRLGAYGYLLKPFKFERLRKTLCSLRKHQREIREKKELRSQEDIDKTFVPDIGTTDTKHSFPKGIQENTLNLIIEAMNGIQYPVSANDLSVNLGLSRVTVQRYIFYLKETGHIIEEIEYRKIGRPIKLYSHI